MTRPTAGASTSPGTQAQLDSITARNGTIAVYLGRIADRGAREQLIHQIWALYQEVDAAGAPVDPKWLRAVRQGVEQRHHVLVHPDGRGFKVYTGSEEQVRQRVAGDELAELSTVMKRAEELATQVEGEPEDPALRALVELFSTRITTERREG